MFHSGCIEYSKAGPAHREQKWFRWFQMSLFHISQGFTDGDEMYKSVWQQQEVKGKMFQSVLGRQTMPSVIAEGTKSSISSELPLVKRVLLFVTCVIEKKKIVYCCSKFTFPCPIRYFLIWVAQSGANPACSVNFWQLYLFSVARWQYAFSIVDIVLFQPMLDFPQCRLPHAGFPCI